MSTISKFNLFKNVQNLDASDTLAAYERVYLYYGTDESGNTLDCYYPENYEGSGTTLEVSVDMLPANSNIDASTLAKNIYDSINGFTYQPYTADGALLDPSAEIGDGVDINGLYSGIYLRGIKFGKLMSTELSAPTDEEIDHEYGVQQVTNRSYNRSVVKANSRISQQATAIEARVEINHENTSDAMSWELTGNYWTVKYNNTDVFKVTSDGAYVKGVIFADSGKIGNLNLSEGALFTSGASEWSGDWDSGIHISNSGIRLGDKFKVDSSGNITATNATLLGNLKFKDSSGTEHTLSADTIRSSTQTVQSNSGNWGSAYSVTSQLTSEQRGLSMCSASIGNFTNIRIGGYAVTETTVGGVGHVLVVNRGGES